MSHPQRYPNTVIPDDCAYVEYLCGLKPGYETPFAKYVARVTYPPVWCHCYSSDPLKAFADACDDWLLKAGHIGLLRAGGLTLVEAINESPF